MKKNISILLLTLFVCGGHFCSSAYAAHCSDNCMHRWHHRCNDYYDNDDYEHRGYCNCCGKYCYKLNYCSKCKKYYCGRCVKHCASHNKGNKEEQQTTKTETKK